MSTQTKRGRRFERRLAERKERAAMGEEKTIFGVLSEARSIAARTEFGFGNKRLTRFMDEMNTLADEMNAKLLDEKGIIKALKSECDLEITM